MTATTDKQKTAPTNVVGALAAVMADLPGIGKGEKSAQGYSYRGIEQITAQAQPLLAKYGVVFVPQVLEVETREVIVNGKPWTDERLRVLYTVYGPGGVEDKITVGPVLGIGRDNSDKGANKAMSQAYKYALLQTLCIGDAKDDGDQQSHATDDRRRPGPQGPPPNVDARTGEVRQQEPRRRVPTPGVAQGGKPTLVEAAQQVKSVDPIGQQRFDELKARKQALSTWAQEDLQTKLSAAGLLAFSKESSRAEADKVEAIIAEVEAENAA